jgi:hypothetical protein
VAEPFREGDRGRRLALARLRRSDGRDGDQLSVGPRRETLENRGVDLGLVAAVELELGLVEVEAFQEL